ncbi:DNA cytosine methyltransferase [Roseovarius faecimaris]|uniref:Cytosine-specific methyltransferase n=1 Tax=Roseovarius faecimaris TaxID=2494550 RepID=A0A6I6IVH4_9RHOB|nr:DNA cytosine methyltransferase [Roseovarius faecimaris]QGY00183.1 DNA cytosine methyltransferase [Roseovarius faecimaris]
MNSHQSAFVFERDDDGPSTIWPIDEQTANWSDKFGCVLRQNTSFAVKPKVLSLFSGAGGLDIGFHDCGFEIVETVEFEQKFVDTLEANTRQGGYFDTNTKNTCCDIREFEPNFSDIDFIIGGPPCQPFSAAGARAAGVSGTKDARGTLFLEYVRLLRLFKPRGFLFENVYRILGANGGKDWAAIVSEFEAAGYRLKYRILNSADYGVAQLRERLIIVGVRKDLAENFDYQFPRPTHGPDSDGKIERFCAGLAISDISQPVPNSGLRGRYGNLLFDIPPGLNYSFYTEKLGHPEPVFAWRSKFSDFLYKADPKRPVRTIKALGGQYTGPFHWDSRPFTVAELKRLQSFPDKYEVVGSRATAIQQLGNSVPPQFARILAASIAEQIFEAVIPIKLSYLGTNEELSFTKEKRLLTKYYEKLAIEANTREIPPSSLSAPSYEKYNARMELDHSWRIGKLSDYSHRVLESEDNGQLLICVKSKSSKRRTGIDWKFVITPVKDWSLPFAKIVVTSSGETLNDVQAAWKAFERFLIRNSLKADLVQLFNYYQYAPAAIIKCDLSPDSLEGRIIKLICDRTLVAEEFSIDQLSAEMNVDDVTARSLLSQLKDSGFEVRSNNTNAAIERGFHLIPYSFPTLTRMSVQRKKVLFA